MSGRVFIGATFGLLLGLCLELVNGFFTFMLPPLFIITPLCVILGVVFALKPTQQ